ncbi:Aldehyde oxidase GLOX [Bienertia sinuspersici]
MAAPTKNIGISAMHMQLLDDDRIIIFDRTDFGASELPLPHARCRRDPNEQALQIDCTADSVEYNSLSNTFCPLMLLTDTWCSSGATLPNGTLVQTGGFNDGERVVRIFQPSCSTCDWIEIPNMLLDRRWYATNHVLPDGPTIIIAILFNYTKNVVVRTYPTIPGGDPRSYPSTGSAVLLPLENLELGSNIEMEVLVCGGAPPGSYLKALNTGQFLPALNTCARMKITDPNPTWVIETMPKPRVMGDMLILPHGDILLINGAGSGTAGWELGRDPVLNPIIYHPDHASGSRCKVQKPTKISRLYHSSAILLRDGRVLVGGSNPHRLYNFTNQTGPGQYQIMTAGSANIAPPGFYLLFVVHRSVPSIGIWAQLTW